MQEMCLHTSHGEISKRVIFHCGIRMYQNEYSMCSPADHHANSRCSGYHGIPSPIHALTVVTASRIRATARRTSKTSRQGLAACANRVDKATSSEILLIASANARGS